MIKKQAERKAENINNYDVTESNRMSQLKNDGTQRPADMDPNKNMGNVPQLPPKIPATNNQDQDSPMDVSKLNLDFLGMLSKGFSNFNPTANRDSKVNVSVLIGNKNVSVENKNVLQ